MDLEKRESLTLASDDIATLCADAIADYRSIEAVCGDSPPDTQMGDVLDAAAITLASHMAAAAGSLGLMDRSMVEFYQERAMDMYLDRFQDRLKPVFEVLESQDPDKDRKAAILLAETLRDAVNVVVSPVPLPPLPPLKAATQTEIDRVLAVTGPRPASGTTAGWGSVLAAAREMALQQVS